MTQLTGHAIGWAVTPPAICALCGHQGADVATMLIRWRDGQPFGYGPRCRDHDACHDRVGANGDEWPVDDGRPRGVVRQRADHPEVIPAATTDELLELGEAP